MTQDQNAKAYFSVNDGETVTVKLDSVKTNCLTAAAFGEPTMQKSSSNPDTYVFKVEGSSGDQPTFAAVCTFARADSPSARYEVAISSDSGDCFTIPDIYKEAPEASFNLFFQID